jgi:lipid A 4'-phosphatase
MQLANSEADLGWIEDPRTSRMCAFGGILALAIGGPIFILLPELDLVTAGFFFDHQRLSFAGESAAVETLRGGFKLLYIAAFLFAIAGTISVSVRACRAINMDRSKWLFLMLCMAVGPGLVSNLALKDQWSRARPKQIVEFGGTKSFTPPRMLRLRPIASLARCAFSETFHSTCRRASMQQTTSY